MLDASGTNPREKLFLLIALSLPFSMCAVSAFVAVSGLGLASGKDGNMAVMLGLAAAACCCATMLAVVVFQVKDNK